jgi:hypothetical protein
MREICTSGSVGGEDGNILAYPAGGRAIRPNALACDAPQHEDEPVPIPMPALGVLTHIEFV